MSESVSVVIALSEPPNDMAQEEVLKQVAHLSREIARPRFSPTADALLFDAPQADAGRLEEQARLLVRKIQRALGRLQRKVAFETASYSQDPSRFRGDADDPDGVVMMGEGQAALEGMALALFRYFDQATEAVGADWRPSPLLTPTLIPAPVLAKCGYFRSFPHTVTFAGHLPEDASLVEAFTARHKDRDDLDEQTVRDLAPVTACLTPATCYHVYSRHRGRTLPADGTARAVCGKCFRYEAGNLGGLRRLWDFTMRELVFLGPKERILEHRDRALERVARFLSDHDLAGVIRTASDPFFAAADSVGKTYFQLNSETKFEVALALPDGKSLAVGSLNLHGDFFGKAFDIQVEGRGLANTGCVAFGLERMVHAFVGQHGRDPSAWPDIVRRHPLIEAAR